MAKQLLSYLTTARLLPDLQSAYRAFYSTETAVLKVMSDILLAVDRGDLAVLTLLDLSAAFGTGGYCYVVSMCHTASEDQSIAGSRRISAAAPSMSAVGRPGLYPDDRPIRRSCSYCYMYDTINSKGILFFRELGLLLSARSGDTRETAFLFQRLSIAIQRFNSIAFHGIFPQQADSDS